MVVVPKTHLAMWICSVLREYREAFFWSHVTVETTSIVLRVPTIVWLLVAKQVDKRIVSLDWGFWLERDSWHHSI